MEPNFKLALILACKDLARDCSGCPNEDKDECDENRACWKQVGDFYIAKAEASRKRWMARREKKQKEEEV